jgi:transposase
MWSIGLDAHEKLYVYCILNADGGRVKEGRTRTLPELVTVLRALPQPFQICYEASCSYGYLYDQLRQVAQRVVVAHPGALRLIFQSKRKNDRVDARKLAVLLLLNQVPAVHVPREDVRSWRRLIEYRRRVVAQQTRGKNALRALLRQHGIAAPYRKSLWTKAGLRWLSELELGPSDARLQRDLLLDDLSHVRARLATVERTLNARGRRHAGVVLLQTIPGVGPRTAEALVAWIDDPRRFRHNRQVGCYFGLVPCQDQSVRNRLGHITREGPSVVRQLLTEAAWQGIRRSETLQTYYEQVRRGDPERRKIALVATARHLAVVALAMLKTGKGWRHEEVPAAAQTPSVA